MMIRRTCLLISFLVALLAPVNGFAGVQPFGTKSAAPSSTELAVKVKVQVGDGEPIESAIRRFKREVNKSGHLMELRHRRHFENSQDRKKRKIKEARMRKKFERIQRRRMQQQSS